jgi:dethiobiotin synthetase
MRSHAVFITGTDTGVGKTVVTALLLAHLRARGRPAIAMKPISCGDRHDAHLFHGLADCRVPFDRINPIHFQKPLAPLAAARMERRHWDVAIVQSAFCSLGSTFSPVLVEGIGGLLVPLKRGYAVADMVKDLRLPLLIVARPGLGTLNHTALTVEAARSRGIRVLGIIFNSASGRAPDLAERTNAKVIEQVCSVKLLGRFPYISMAEDRVSSIRSAAQSKIIQRCCSAVEKVL